MNSSTAPSPLYPLDPMACETIVAPLHDPAIARTLPLVLEPRAGIDCTLDFGWCYTVLTWNACATGEDATALTFDCDVAIENRYDRVLCCLSMARDVHVRFELRFDDTTSEWQPIGGNHAGVGVRIEIELPLPPGTRRLSGIRAIFRAGNAGARGSVLLSWIGLAAGTPQSRDPLASGRQSWDARWPGLIAPDADWGDVRFARGLLFDADDLPRLREKRKLPGWENHFAVLEARAKKFLAREPESDLGEFLPWSDIRYSRQREHGKEPYFWESLTLGFVGLINNDRRMIRLALRYLLCMAHTTHWCQSAESRLKGSAWDQRCFLEEMATTSSALLLDWLGFALTPRARELVTQAIWDKGLAYIERDTMKFEYVHHNNQGPWFDRAKVLGGLMLEIAWPRVGDYVDRAIREQRAAMDDYILADGGSDEGIGYFSTTLHAVLPSMIAYARARKVDVKSLLPRHLSKCGRFVSVMSAVEPGNVLLDGDNSTDYLIGDTIPILAKLFPGGVYDRILAASLLKDRPATYYNQYVLDGLFAFVLGPDEVKSPSTSIVPTFANLEHVGHLTSLRTTSAGQTVRLHVTGCKANPGHSHLDKGALTLEVDGVPLLIDRGTVRYDDSRCEIMHRSALHNVITPVLAGGIYPDQGHADQAILPQGSGDARVLTASVDLTQLWRSHMSRCARTIQSGRPEHFTVVDAGMLLLRGRVAFHLHARRPFRIEGQSIFLAEGPTTLRIDAPWAESIEQREDLIDYLFRPIHHLALASEELTDFSLQTAFRFD